MSLDFQLSKNNKTVTKIEPYFDLSKHQKLVTLCSTLVYENEPKDGMLKKQKFQWHKSGSFEDPSYFTTKRRDYAMYEKIIFMHNEITNEMFQVKKNTIFQKNPMKIYDFFQSLPGAPLLCQTQILKTNKNLEGTKTINPFENLTAK